MIRLHNQQDLQRTSAVARTYGLRSAEFLEYSVKRELPFREASRKSPLVFVRDDAVGKLSTDGATVEVVVKFHVSLKESNAEDALGMLVVQGAIELAYARTADGPSPTQEDVDCFARINGVYNAWPYIREATSVGFARVGYLPYTLDSLVIGAKPEGAEVAANTPAQE
ncbi:MAG: hypothetical protein JNN27_00815 [Planctomycetes bacterium]|nr:hypothetical protein [Planctomycetota bacterium]